MTYTTLTYNGTEKSLIDWGLALDRCVLTLANLEADTFTAALPQVNCLADPIWPFEGQIVLRTGRSKALDGSYSGGLIEFSGKRMMQVIDGRPDFEGVYYTFAGPWYDIHQCAYQQPAAYWLPGSTWNATAASLSSSVLLFAKLVGGALTWVTTKQQILDALQHVLDMNAAQGLPAPFQVALGNIDVNLPLVYYPMQDVKVSEVIDYCLRMSPDARLWFDYSTTPPTAKVTSRANCTPATIAVADGKQHESLKITPRPDLQARGVVIYFLLSYSTTDPSPPHEQIAWIERIEQKYGPHGLNSGLDPEGGLRVIVCTLDLQGWQVSNVYGSLNALAVTNDLPFWSTVIPELQSTQVREFSVLGNMTILDSSGSAVSLGSLPNALMDGSSICSWMKLGSGSPVVGTAVTITADVTYKMYDVEATGGDRSATNGNLLEWFPKKRLTWRGTITNGVTGNYSATQSIIAQQPIPTNLAQLIYQSLATLQYEGDVTIVVKDISGGINMGNVLNLSNGRAEWATMNAQIQSIRKELGSGLTTIIIGPSRFLSAGDLTRIFEGTRYRHVFQNPACRQSGQSSSGEQGVTLPTNAVRENTNTGLEARQFLRMLFTQES